MRKPSLGEQELALLRHIADHAPVSVSEVAQGYGLPRGLARTTVQTMMERLRRKGRLTREKARGSYRYRPAEAKADLQQGLVRDFVQRALGGSLEPFVSYLMGDARLTGEEARVLEGMVRRMEEDARQGRHEDAERISRIE
jgi:predicted transcriptional regulator